MKGHQSILSLGVTETVIEVLFRVGYHMSNPLAIPVYFQGPVDVLEWLLLLAVEGGEEDEGEGCDNQGPLPHGC